MQMALASSEHGTDKTDSGLGLQVKVLQTLEVVPS